MSDYIEPAEAITEKDKNITRALNSIKEEIEAINWYNQRVSASKDADLSKVMAHNRDEEIEHACMAIEWLRRNMDGWDEELRTYIFSEGDITALEDNEEEETEDLRIGDLK
jgi:uncharacterized protein